MQETTALTDLTDFLHSHLHHGALMANATEPAWNGLLAGGVVFGQWVTPADAELSTAELLPQCSEHTLPGRSLVLYFDGIQGKVKIQQGDREFTVSPAIFLKRFQDWASD
jgi:hypothetical protein